MPSPTADVAVAIVQRQDPQRFGEVPVSPRHRKRRPLSFHFAPLPAYLRRCSHFAREESHGQVRCDRRRVARSNPAVGQELGTAAPVVSHHNLIWRQEVQVRREPPRERLRGPRRHIANTPFIPGSAKMAWAANPIALQPAVQDRHVYRFLATVFREDPFHRRYTDRNHHEVKRPKHPLDPAGFGGRLGRCVTSAHGCLRAISPASASVLSRPMSFADRVWR